MNKTYTLGSDSESDCYALYDEKGNLIRGWQFGDDISRVLRDVLSSLNISLKTKDIDVDGDFPKKI